MTRHIIRLSNEEPASNQRSPYLRADGTFIGGFKGCILHFTRTKGLATKNAQRLCAYIGRRAGKIAGAEPAAAANAFTVAQDEWLRIPYGEYPHQLGFLERLTREAAENMVTINNTFRNRLANAFGGVPIYKGHPDDRHFAAQHTDDSAYGWIKELEARDDGFYFRPEWTDAGMELLANARYKYFSPRWDLVVVGQEAGRNVVEPVELLSVGLTNRPVIKVAPLANAEGNNLTEEEKVMIEFLRQLFGLAATATEEEVKTAASNAVAAGTAKAEVDTALANAEKAKTEVDGQLVTLANEKTALDKQIADEKKAREEAEKKFTDERKAHAGLVVSNAVAAGKVRQADAEGEIVTLSNDLAAGVERFKKAPVIVKVKSSTDGLGERNSQEQQSRQSEILTLVNQKMKDNNWGRNKYDLAFEMVKREKPALFEEQPASEE